ncbi:MAG TPA: hypothetical protein VH518_07830, partial [Tepidisphaeraceae bacterium]
FNQFWLAAQHDWGGCRGFFFVVEAPFAAGQPSRLDGAKLLLGVGDGSRWKFVSGQVNWKLDQTYSAKAVIKDGAAEIWVDGQRIAQDSANFTPAGVDLAFNQQPSFLRGPAEYRVVETRLTARGDSGEPVQPPLTASTLAPQLQMFGAGADSARVPFKVQNAVTIEADFSFAAPRNLRELAPFVDRYGQSIQAQWDGKVRSDDDLKAADAQEKSKLEEWGDAASSGYDRYGGFLSAPWKSDASGFFRVTKRDGKWWLISPGGNPCFYIGLCDAPALDWEATPVSGREFLFEWLPPKTGEFALAWRVNAWSSAEESNSDYLAWHTVNMIRKFGATWQKQATVLAVRRAKALGFSGFGKWSAAGCGVPDLPVLFHGAVPNISRHPDIFDPKIRSRFETVLRQQIEPRKSDPWLLGWSVGNENDECITTADVTKILAMGADVPCKRAMIDFAKSSIFGGDEQRMRTEWKIASGGELLDAKPEPPAEHVEKLRRFYAQHFYEFIYRTVKSIDPNHLYFGMWVTPNWWVNEGDWEAVAPNCDVIGYDFYAPKFDAQPTARLIAAQDKPVLCGEFSCPPHYRGTRGLGRYANSCADDAASGAFYAQWLADAARHPQCVGVLYFQYRDQPITGRGPAPGSDAALVRGEDFAFGLVDVTDRLKWDFVKQVREANLAAGRTRLGQTHK